MMNTQTHLHRTDDTWLRTSKAEPRGYIDPRRLRELWFHTGTACNLRCPDCFEHSAPGDLRLESPTFQDLRPFIDEAVTLGVEQLSFTGGEPFVAKDMARILDYALDRLPCLVLTNGTRPLQSRLQEILPLADKPRRLSFRVSLDYPSAEKHDAGRGSGMFSLALDTLGRLHRGGFHVSIARRREEAEDPAAVATAFQACLSGAGLPVDTLIIAFPNLNPDKTPEITETCMSTYHTPASCEKFMCAFSRMVVKQGGVLRVYACTLVDDDPCYDLGASVKESANVRVTLGHPRCFACFAGGASCSEL